ncbi:FGGY family carbohydrate kinase [Microlunatus spumicola]|uniref:FGGY family carbohydrate kinase n=1 Tax=Microlunatus spumicola TaxID=81499 RepID=A0ABP6X054_9ACTN
MADARRTPVACGVDVGSTNVKVVVLDRDGRVLARASSPTPRDTSGLSVESLALVDLVERLVLKVCGDVHEVHAVCTVGMGEDGMLLDADLVPLSSALSWFDPRRQGVVRTLRARLDDDQAFDAADDAARTMVGWAWAREQPGAEAGVAWVAVADLVAVRWTGRPFLSDTLASRTGAWRASSRTWAPGRVAASLGPVDLLPAVLPAGDVVGRLRSSRLRAAGAVADGAVVVAGGHDHPVGGWAVDRLLPGSVLDSMGTAEVVVAQSRLPPPLVHPDVDVAPGIRSTGTTVLRVVELARNAAWAAQDPDVARWMTALVEGTARPEPVLESGYFRPGGRGGRPPSYRVDAPRAPYARASAVLGALACAGRTAVDAVSGDVGGPPRVRAAGGWSRSPGWMEIKQAVNRHRSDALVEPEVTAVGAACLAALAVGWDPDPAVALGEPGTA